MSADKTTKNRFSQYKPSSIKLPYVVCLSGVNGLYFGLNIKVYNNLFVAHKCINSSSYHADPNSTRVIAQIITTDSSDQLTREDELS